ncbi:MAG TPA: UrcA family protein [Sphingomicrobium sp.]|nr:UrcA family protein [Sphingomicrobium sp.]
MKQTLKIIAVSAFATAAIIKAVPAFAAESPSQNVSIVHTYDLDLSSRAGQKALDHRLIDAAFKVCGTASDVDIAGKNEVRSCRANVLEKARASSAEIAKHNASILIASGR